MKISLEWLGEHVDLSGLDPETIADRLTLRCAEVEGIEHVRHALEGVLVGEVISVEPLPSLAAGRLVAAEIDCGHARFITVTGAPNVRRGMRSAFAPPGAVLAGAETVREQTVSGRRSQGMLCSPRELGLSQWHEGVLECPPSEEPGTLLCEIVPAEDVIIEIDNKSVTHRPDLWGHYGFARELAAIFGRQLRPLAIEDLSAYDALPPYPVVVEDPAGCRCYTALEISIPGRAPSPLKIQRRLHVLGQRTPEISVDLTNYVMLELGQPMHAFDADKMKAVRVAVMESPQKFLTLDGQERALIPGDLMIWNNAEPVAIAGVMGGLGTQVEASTTRLLLESASFDPARIRRTSVRLGLRTESSQRFEKNQPPANARAGTARFVALLRAAGVTPRVTSQLTLAGDPHDRLRTIDLEPNYIERMAGTGIPDSTVADVLSALGFRVETRPGGGLGIGIPPYRGLKDITQPIDLVEEVLRIRGYDTVKPRLPSAELSARPPEKRLRIEHKARRILTVAHRFIEVHTYGWMDDRWLEAIGYEARSSLILENPTTVYERRMRTALLPNLLYLVHQNRPYRESFRLFELGRTFRLSADGSSDERTHLAGVSYCPARGADIEEHVRSIRGAIEDVLAAAGSPPAALEPGTKNLEPWQAEDWGVLRSAGHDVGTLGAAPAALLAHLAPEGQVVWFEIDMDVLEGEAHLKAKYVPAPVYPGSWQDFSILWSTAEGQGALAAKLDRFRHSLVTRREYLYSYKGKGVPEGMASHTFRYWMGSPDRTLAAEDIEAVRAAFLLFIEFERITLR